MNGAGPSRKRIVVTGPAEALDAWRQAAESELLTLPHPRSGVPAYFLPYKRARPSRDEAQDADGSECDGLLELSAVKPETAQRSWFLGSTLDGEQPTTLKLGEPPDYERVRDTVIGDGSLHMFSPVDPLFVVLSLLMPNPSQSTEKGTLPYMALEDLFDRASQRFTAEAAQDADEKVDPGQTWTDITEFGETRIARQAAERVCDWQDVGDGSLKVYRVSRPKVLSELAAKVDKLAASPETFDAAPETLGRKLAKLLDKDGQQGEKEVLKARRTVACDALAPWLHEGWVTVLKQHYAD